MISYTTIYYRLRSTAIRLAFTILTAVGASLKRLPFPLSFDFIIAFSMLHRRLYSIFNWHFAFRRYRLYWYLLRPEICISSLINISSSAISIYWARLPPIPALILCHASGAFDAPTLLIISRLIILMDDFSPDDDALSRPFWYRLRYFTGQKRSHTR